MIMDDNDGQMIFGDLGGLKLPDICLTAEEKPRKKPSPRKLVRGSRRIEYIYFVKTLKDEFWEKDRLMEEVMKIS